MLKSPKVLTKKYTPPLTHIDYECKLPLLSLLFALESRLNINIPQISLIFEASLVFLFLLIPIKTTPPPISTPCYLSESRGTSETTNGATYRLERSFPLSHDIGDSKVQK